MKKTFFLMLAVVLIGSACCIPKLSAQFDVADTAGVQASESMSTLTGKVDGIAQGGGIKAQVTIRQENGQQEVFGVASDASIIDKNGEEITLSWVKGKKVSIEYVTLYKGGFYAGREIKSIKVLPK